MHQVSLKNFIRILTALVLLEQFFLWGGAVAIPPQYDRTWLGELKYKCTRLHDSQGPRIIVVGGSGAAFNVDCGLIEEEFPGYTAVNFGLYAALGSKVMLELCQPEIHEGDIILFMPEQHAQTLSLYSDGRNLIEALDGADRGQFAALHLRQRLDIADQEAMTEELPVLAWHKFRYWLTDTTPDPQTVYARSSFDEYGDVRPELAAANTMDGGYDTNTKISYDAGALPEDFIDYLNAYARQTEKAGGQFMFVFGAANEMAIETGANADSNTGSSTEAFSASGGTVREESPVEEGGTAGSLLPSVPENNADQGEDFLDQYADDLAAAFCFPVLGDPHNAVMDAGWFFDTNYHLNAAGKQLYTRNLIRTLKAHLGITTATNIAIPEMPGAPEDCNAADAIAAGGMDSIASPSSGGGNQREPDSYGSYYLEDTDAFTWTVNDRGTAALIGLTEEGRKKEKLTVPAYVSGNSILANTDSSAQDSTNDTASHTTEDPVSDNTDKTASATATDSSSRSTEDPASGNAGKSASATATDSASRSTSALVPVRRLASTLFANDTTLQSVVIPDTVTVIEDGAFSGCSALRQIQLDSPDPTTVSVGQELLEGTSATLYVPQESLSSYLTDYNFSQYAGRIRGY